MLNLISAKKGQKKGVFAKPFKKYHIVAEKRNLHS